MYIYHLKRPDSCVTWETMAGAVVIAGSEEEARLLVSQEHWDEGPGAWLDPDYASIEVLGPAAGEAEPRIVLKDQRSG